MVHRRARFTLSLAALALLVAACDSSIRPRDRSDLTDLIDADSETTEPADASDTDGADGDTGTEDADVDADVIDADGSGDADQSDGADMVEPLDCFAACAEIAEGIENCLGGIIGGAEATPAMQRAGVRFHPRSTAIALPDGIAWSGVERQIREVLGDVPADAVHISRRERLVIVDGLPLDAAARRTLADKLGGHEVPALHLRDGSRAVALPRVNLGLTAPGALDRAALEAVGLVVVEEIGRTTALARATDPSTDVFALADAAARLSGVRWAEPDLVRSYEPRGVDEFLAEQWHLDASTHPVALPGADIQAFDAWQVTRGSSDVIITVFDDGVDWEHPDLVDNVVLPAINAPENLGSALDSCCLHGTSVAGVAAARGDNDIGVSGVCPECSILPVFVEFTTLSDATVASGFVDAVDRGAAVINNSWGPVGGDPAVDDEPPFGGPAPLASVVADALDYAETFGRDGRGTVVVWAAGNYNDDVAADPYNAVETVISVAAFDDQRRKSWYSDWGNPVDVAAPSSGGMTPGIVTTVPFGSASLYGDYLQGDVDDRYTLSFGGTSSASPTVAGLAGLMIAANPELTAAQVRELLASTADPIDTVFGNYAGGQSPYYGAGAINAYRAVLAAQNLAGTCDTTRPEVCNGVDDDCDGSVDDGCPTLPACSTCTFAAECASGHCARTPNDVDERCLEPCASGGVCPTDHTCRGTLCVPDTGRCADCSDEVCNGVDDDCDGDVDEEGVCERSETARCDYDAQCDATERCVVGVCRRTCVGEADCEGDLCLPVTDRYGAVSAGANVCVVRPGTRVCYEYVCQRQRSETRKRRFFDCARDSELECGGMVVCLLNYLAN